MSILDGIAEVQPTPPKPVDAQQAPSASTIGAAVNDPAAPVQAADQTEFMQRVVDAANKLGINTATLKDQLPHLLLAELEAAAAGFENAKVSADAPLYKALGVRLLAALHAL